MYPALLNGGGDIPPRNHCIGTARRWKGGGAELAQETEGNKDDEQVNWDWNNMFGTIFPFISFLGATMHLFNWLCLLVGWLVGLSVCM